MMYDRGQGVRQDFDQAAYWYRKAAEQEDTLGQYALDAMYYQGHGVPQDYVTTLMWINLSIAGGDSGHVEARDSLTEKMTPAQIVKARRLAGEWLANH